MLGVVAHLVQGRHVNDCAGFVVVDEVGIAVPAGGDLDVSTEFGECLLDHALDLIDRGRDEHALEVRREPSAVESLQIALDEITHGSSRHAGRLA